MQKNKNEDGSTENVDFLRNRIAELEVLVAERRSSDELNKKLNEMLREKMNDLQERDQLLQDSNDQLKLNSERFIQLAQHSRTVAWEVDAEGFYTYVSQVSENVFGYSPAELVGKLHFYDLTPQSDREMVKKSAFEIFKSKEPFKNFINTIQTKEGVQICVSTSGIPLLKPDGTLEGYRGSDTDITERKRAEDTAKREQLLSKAIIDSIPGTFYVLDENGRYVRWNSYQRDIIVGKTEEQIAGTSALDTIHPDDRDLIQSKIANVLKNGVNEVVEGRVLLKGGPEFKWLLMTGQQLIIDGRPFLVGTGIDITKPKYSEESLRVSEEYLHSIIDSIADPIFVKDSEYKWVLLNKAFCEFMGHPADELKGKSDYDFFPKAEADVFRAKDEEVFRVGGDNVNEELFTDGFGVCRTIVTKKTLYENKDGKKYIVGIIRDISELKKNQEMVLRLNEQQQTILDSSPIMIFYKDKENRFIRVNEALAKANGMTKKEMEGKTMLELYGEAAADYYWQDDKEVIASGKPKLNIIEEMKTSKGSLWVQTDKIPFVDSSGEIIGIIGFTQDITERKKAEEDNVRLQKELEKKVRDLELFQKVTMGREHRVIELKQEIKELREQLDAKKK